MLPINSQVIYRGRLFTVIAVNPRLGTVVIKGEDGSRLAVMGHQLDPAPPLPSST